MVDIDAGEDLVTRRGFSENYEVARFT